MASQLEPVRWGVLGVADIAVKKVIPAMVGSELSRIEAIASRSLDRATRAASDLGIARAHGSYEDLLDDPDVEAVYIPLPNHLHARWAIAAAESGKHVLCEKPLAMTSADARRMIEVADSAGVLLMEAFMYRLHPLWVKIMDLVQSGEIGQVRGVQTIFSYFNDDGSDIRNRSEVGGGALYDIGCYAVNVARLVFGTEPDGVKASIIRDPVQGTDIVTSAVLDFGYGHASFICSTRMESAQRVEIAGTNGRIVVEIPFNIPPDRPTRLQVIAGGDPPVAPAVEVHEVPAADPYAVEADAFSRAVRTGSEVPVPTSDAVANLEVIERIFADAAG